MVDELLLLADSDPQGQAYKISKGSKDFKTNH